MAFCLDCDRPLDLADSLVAGQRVICSYCEVQLEVINVEPLELDWVYDGPAIDFKLFKGDWNPREVSLDRAGGFEAS
jgi:hypothetical protein